uniref:DNA excision repair protein ERCC-6 n=1 Tax=Kwoniella pini CBS 10737 TaxID=1296096 RepID=A0A1B9I8C9_9TREE|nr:uncharacterized protein I206_02465 [Kwoniella pini CBS 10737]OCF51749.1 hypothetical protein I206_02465 [Kwoniella pini CBS 10737]
MTRKRQALVSTAEPLSDDDFVTDARASAKAYAEVQKVQSERERMREDNKMTKRRGEQALALPRLPGGKRTSNGASGGQNQAGSSSLDDEDEESYIEHDGKRVRKRKRNDDNLTYEGQVILPFNPLYSLAGLPDPKGKAAEAESARQKSISRLAGGSSASSPSRSSPLLSANPGDPSEDMNEGYKEERPHELAEDNDEAPEGDYDDETEEVVVPWGQPIADDNAEEDLGEEVLYSEDEGLFKQSKTEIKSNTMPFGERLEFDDLPPYRPTFPFSLEQAQIGSLSLDHESLEIAVPASINRFLKAYQQVGVKFLYDHYKGGIGGVLGDDMGLGKTIQVISFLSAIMRKTGTSADHIRRKNMIRHSADTVNPRHWPTALIVCPKSLVANWSRELDTWGYFEYATWRSDNWSDIRTSFQQGFVDILLTSYDTARNTIEHLKSLPLSVVIVDEAHRMKEPRAQATLALKSIDCKICFALTGTLVQNRMDEMWSILDFSHRGWAGTLKEWKEFAVNPIKRGHRHEGSTADVITAIMRLGVMTQKILPHFYLRRDKKLIAHELPEKRDMVVFCPLAYMQIMAYQNLIASDDIQFLLRRNDKCECGSGQIRRLKCHHPKTENGETVSEVLLRNLSACKKVANHFGLLYHAKDDSAHTREINRHFFKVCVSDPLGIQSLTNIGPSDPGNCGKWTLLEQMLLQWRNDPDDNKVLIFSNSVRLLKMISEFISTSSTLAGFAFDMLTGEVGNTERMDMVDRFQDRSKDHYVLLISTLAGGVGLNLTAANKVVIFDPDWNPANDLQAMDRAFRIGQKRTVDVYRLIGQGTVEELMYERQIHKQQRSRQLNDGTFESRIHQGFDGAKTAEDQGELFGIQNIFRFDAKGFVSQNVSQGILLQAYLGMLMIQQIERVRQAEDRFVQDLIEAEYDESDGEDEESEDEAGKYMRNERKARDLHRAHLNAMSKRQGENDGLSRRNNEGVVKDILGDGSGLKKEVNEDILQRLGVNTRIHEQAFRDSPEERAIYEIGVQILRSNPDMAKKIKANDLGKLGRSVAKRKQVTDVNEEPWAKRLQEKSERAKSEGSRERKRVLAELSD